MQATEGSTLQIVSNRLFDVSKGEMFDAWTGGERLANWWGPSGFTNTFEVFEPWPGGQWTFVMHGANGKSFPNQSEFVEVKRPERIVINHVCVPYF